MSKLAAIRAGDPRRIELESADAIYQYEKGRSDRLIPEDRDILMSSVVDGFLWSSGN